ncbi:hypothetical protein [Actinokineospora xionganensis]|uniref:DUF4386 family protein n=1 Tax=Actinokineospora xionganensis TaxID=2684470 RepID=A0ABR7LCX2_9PSEU|nr:hypothetical protein [Actinokineospora xionganensis]MBC6450556.1 hypothetical protein [Actinokineospora xionganensis]
MTNETDKSVPRWAGLTSIGGGLLLLVVFAWVIAFAGADPAGPAGPINKFPEIKTVRIVENGFYLAVLLLWIPLYLALCRGLARTAPALIGGALGLLGLGVLAVGAIPHAATSRLADLYHAPGATAADQATLALIWQGTQGIYDGLVLTGLLVMAAGIVLIGRALHADPAYGRGIAWLSILLGVVGLVAGTVVLIDPTSPAAALGVFALIAFHLVLGRKVHRLSKMVTPVMSMRTA